MFVWIPRYAYSLKEYAVEKNTEGKEIPITDVTFLVGTTNQDVKGNSYLTDYNIDDINKGEDTPKIAHPGFTFAQKKKTGIWVGKFEASMKEPNNNTNANNNVGNKTVKVIPNVESWRYISIGNGMNNCLNMSQKENIYGLTNDANVHLIKNSEWGIVSYLAVSQYGIAPTVNGKTSNYTGGGDYKAYVSQSTTNNITGVYDLNGGSYEYVAAYWNNGDSNIQNYGTSTYFNNNKVKEEYAKYWDQYEASKREIDERENGLWNKDVSYNKVRKKIAEDRVDFLKKKKGDGTYEIINNFSYYGKFSNGNYDWLIDENSSTNQYGKSYYNNDFVLVGNCALPFIIRGGYGGIGSYAGVFSYSDRQGSANSIYSFRPAIVI